MEYPRAFINSTIILILSCGLLIVAGSLAAYAIANVKNKIINRLYIFIVALIALPFQLAMVPLVFLLKDLNLLNSFVGTSFVYAATSMPFVIFLYVGYMRTLPKELEEAAIVDGCGMLKTYLLIYMPLLKMITATVLILRGVHIWNNLLVVVITISTGKMATLPLRLYSFVTVDLTRWELVFGSTMIVSLPIIILFLALQRTFIKGIVAGSVKG
jgi:raffinose/stachyose/melibiose transport system permease protein